MDASDPAERAATSAAEQARAGLAGPRHSISEALALCPDAPGLYAVYAVAATWNELQIETTNDNLPLYIGKAEDSLVRRDIRTHFATGKTGSSTLRRSFAALLVDQLDLEARPRNPLRPGHFANYGLASEGDARLTKWMHRNLTIAFWTGTAAAELDAIETAVLLATRPPLNLSKVPNPSATLKAARAAMAAAARTWAQSRGQ